MGQNMRGSNVVANYKLQILHKPFNPLQEKHRMYVKCTTRPKCKVGIQYMCLPQSVYAITSYTTILMGRCRLPRHVNNSMTIALNVAWSIYQGQLSLVLNHKQNFDFSQNRTGNHKIVR